LDIATDTSGLPPNQGDGNFNIGICANGECWATLDSVKALLSITDFCNKELLFTFHVNVGTNTCFPRDPNTGNNVPLGQAWFIAQKVLITCPPGTCCCCPVTTPPQGKFCEIGTGFGVPLGCSGSGICGTNTLESLGCGRWGWYHKIESLPYGPVDFHVGAGNNNLGNGESAGTVEVKTCSSGSGICAFYVMNPGYRLNSAHVDSRCEIIKTKDESSHGYPCAPGSYNTNGGGGCPGPNGLGSTWESQPFLSCPGLPVYAIFHGTVSKSLDPGDDGYDTCAEGCGNSDT
jgi:hypothetical protein